MPTATVSHQYHVSAFANNWLIQIAFYHLFELTYICILTFLTPVKLSCPARCCKTSHSATANISQLEQFAPRLSHKAVAKEHKKSESYQLTRSLRSAVLSHSSCSYVTCRSGFQFTFAREPLLPPTMLIAARWSCVRAGENSDPYRNSRRWHFLLVSGCSTTFTVCFVALSSSRIISHAVRVFRLSD